MNKRRGPLDRAAEKAAKSKDNHLTLALNRYAPQELKARWVEELHDNASAAFKSLLTGSAHVCKLCGCERPNVQAVRLYCELAGAVGAQQQILVSLHQSLGVRDEAELATLLEGGRRLENLRADLAANPRELLDSALEAAAMVLAKHPEWRAAAVARLGSFAEAVEVEPHETNGHG